MWYGDGTRGPWASGTVQMTGRKVIFKFCRLQNNQYCTSTALFTSLLREIRKEINVFLSENNLKFVFSMFTYHTFVDLRTNHADIVAPNSLLTSVLSYALLLMARRSLSAIPHLHCLPSSQALRSDDTRLAALSAHEASVVGGASSHAIQVSHIHRMTSFSFTSPSSAL